MHVDIKSVVPMLGFFSLGLATASAAGHGPVAAPSVAVGDTWTYQYTDMWKNQPGNLTRQEVVDVKDDAILIDAKRAKDGFLLSHLRLSRELNPVDRGKMHFSPAYPRYAFPLEVGKEWSSDVAGENASAGKKWRYQFKGKAVGWETVTVRAGRFDALKIVVEAYYRGEEVGNNGGTGQSKESVWFAPAVNNFVKMEYTDTDWTGRIFNRDAWELTTFSHQAAAAPAAGGQ
jgi:hypothetical protein